MTPATAQSNDPHEQFGIGVARSMLLADLIDEAWVNLDETDEPRSQATAGLCRLSLEHGRALRLLLPQVPPSAIALLRPQYESLVRAVWARHAASQADLNCLLSPLTPESQLAARKLPGVSEMLTAIKRCGPRGAEALLGRARTPLWDGLNSYIHGGIHPFQRGQDGYPLPMLFDVLKNSNAMSGLTLLVLAELTDGDAVMAFVATVHEEFQNVLPALEPLDV